MDVNAMAHMWLAKAFLPDMIKTNCGHIVTIASAAGLCGVNGLADYCASKFAAVGFDGTHYISFLGNHFLAKVLLFSYAPFSFPLAPLPSLFSFCCLPSFDLRYRITSIGVESSRSDWCENHLRLSLLHQHR